MEDENLAIEFSKNLLNDNIYQSDFIKCLPELFDHAIQHSRIELIKFYLNHEWFSDKGINLSRSISKNTNLKKLSKIFPLILSKCLNLNADDLRECALHFMKPQDINIIVSDVQQGDFSLDIDTAKDSEESDLHLMNPQYPYVNIVVSIIKHPHFSPVYTLYEEFDNINTDINEIETDEDIEEILIKFSGKCPLIFALMQRCTEVAPLFWKDPQIPAKVKNWMTQAAFHAFYMPFELNNYDNFLLECKKSHDKFLIPLSLYQFWPLFRSIISFDHLDWVICMMIPKDVINNILQKTVLLTANPDCLFFSTTPHFVNKVVKAIESYLEIYKENCNDSDLISSRNILHKTSV